LASRDVATRLEVLRKKFAPQELQVIHTFSCRGWAGGPEYMTAHFEPGGRQIWVFTMMPERAAAGVVAGSHVTRIGKLRRMQHVGKILGSPLFDGDLIGAIRQELFRVGSTERGGDSELPATLPVDVLPVEVSPHLCLVINNSTERVQNRVFNCRAALRALEEIADGLGYEHVWDSLIRNDPEAPADPDHFTVTFLDDKMPYLEWRWAGGSCVQNRRVPEVGEHVRKSDWRQLKIAELYYHLSSSSPLGQWLTRIGFKLPEADWERLNNFVPGPELVVYTSTGPSTLCQGDEWDFPGLGWCRITRIERIPSVSDGMNMSEIDEITKDWEEFVYYGYIIEPEGKEGADRGES